MDINKRLRQLVSDSSNGMRGDDCVPVPKQIFEEHLHHLTGVELKVIMYIVIRTLGYGKTTDRISLSQFSNGITRWDGVDLDKGTGCATSAIKNAIASLEAKGLITIGRRGPNNQGESNSYSLNAYIDRETPADNDS